MSQNEEDDGIDIEVPRDGAFGASRQLPRRASLRGIVALLAVRYYVGEDVEVADAALSLSPYWARCREALDETDHAAGVPALRLTDLTGEPDYTDLMEYRAVPLLLVGLHKLVEHSDADGWHSPGDVADIAALLDALLPTLEEEMKAIGGDAETLTCVHAIAIFFIEAARTRSTVLYL